MLSRAQTLERWPGLNPEGLLGSALYYDAQVEFPERLVLANVLSAREFGAEVLTHTRVRIWLSKMGRFPALSLFLKMVKTAR